VLREAGLVTVRAEGTRRLYALDTDGIDAARAWLGRLADPLESFTQPLDALATELARGRRARRPATPDQARPTAAPGVTPLEATRPGLAQPGEPGQRTA
jgi:hypothetical protein